MLPLKNRSKKFQPSKHPASLGIPTSIAAGPLGFRTALDLNTSEGALLLTEIQQPITDFTSGRREGFSDRTSG